MKKYLVACDQQRPNLHYELCTAPSLPEAIWDDSRGDSRSVDHGIVAFLCFCGRDVADGLEKPAVIEPVDPFQRCIFDGFKRSPVT